MTRTDHRTHGQSTCGLDTLEPHSAETSALRGPPFAAHVFSTSFAVVSARSWGTPRTKAIRCCMIARLSMGRFGIVMSIAWLVLDPADSPLPSANDDPMTWCCPHFPLPFFRPSSCEDCLGFQLIDCCYAHSYRSL